MTNQIINWHGCYKSGWKNEIVPDAFQHPAKYARRLIARIYDHLLDERLVTRGDRIVDPFGGVALGALDAMRCGLDWTGVELEPKFHALGTANIALWNARYASLPRWGTAKLLNGDSRNLAQIVRKATCAVSSPPYAETRISAEGGGDENNMRRSRTDDRYVLMPGQLGSMTGGDYAAAISSPPYEGIATGAGGLNTKPSRNGQQGGRNPNSPSQIANQHYGMTDGQLSNESGETFWLASRQIVSGVHSVLAPGGIAVWVVKDFVRNRERVPFCAQWRQLCEHLGFAHLYTARAWLVEDNGTQLAHDGHHRRLIKERKSFFRRLNEKNGGPRIDWEEIIFMQKG